MARGVILGRMSALTLIEARDGSLSLEGTWPRHIDARIDLTLDLLERGAVRYVPDDLLEFSLQDGTRAFYRIRETDFNLGVCRMTLVYAEPGDRIQEAPSVMSDDNAVSGATL